MPSNIDREVLGVGPRVGHLLLEAQRNYTHNHLQIAGASLQIQASVASQVGMCVQHSGPTSTDAEDAQDAAQAQGQAMGMFQTAPRAHAPWSISEEPDRTLRRCRPPQDLQAPPAVIPEGVRRPTQLALSLLRRPKGGDQVLRTVTQTDGLCY